MQSKNKKIFNDKGYIILENKISQEICNAIIKKAKLLRSKGSFKIVQLENSYFETINGKELVSSIPECKILHDQFLTIASDITGKKIKELDNQKIGKSLNFIRHGGNFEFHYDRHLITVVVYLNIVIGGKMIFLPNNRLFPDRLPKMPTLMKKLFFKFESYYYRFTKLFFFKKKKINPYPGRVFIFKGRETYHSVEKVKKGQERISLQFGYDLKKDLFNEKNTKDYYGN